MLDFTSALYLGFEHPSWSLPVWPQLSLGKPAALEQLSTVPEVERQLAELVGCGRVLLGPSTFHLFWDLFRWLTTVRTKIFVASGSYPIAQWAADAARATGASVQTFRHGELPVFDHVTTRPIVVTDGFFPASGRAAPLRECASWVRQHKGVLVIDDTQALGVFGSDPGPQNPFGSGGGGSLRAANLHSGRVVVVSSLAKAFGVPVAMIGGSRNLIKKFEASSETRVHCSPPSAAVVSGAMRALEMNRVAGDWLRARLARRVRRFRTGLAGLGLKVNSHIFPVQPVGLPDEVSAEDLYERLVCRGIEPVLHRAGNGKAVLSFVVTARHRSIEIDALLANLADALKRVREMNKEVFVCRPQDRIAAVSRAASGAEATVTPVLQ